MANEQELREETDLIDVSDIEPAFDDSTPTSRRSNESEPVIGTPSHAPAEGPTIAPIKDRFAAMFVDGIFLYSFYWILMPVHRYIVYGEAAGPIPFAGISGLIFHGVFLLVAILWFLIPELAFGASLGKFLCHLTIRDEDGDLPSFLSILIRNLLRPIDILLFPLFIVAALMEWSEWHRRIGDILARTIVLKKLAERKRVNTYSLDTLAGASGRVIAFIIDFILFAAFVFGMALLLNSNDPLGGMMIIVFLPIAIFLFWALPEWIVKTSPGKWLLGYVISCEDGSGIDLPAAVIRTVWRLFDTQLFGYLTMLFSLRHQRPGDSAAQTVVIKHTRQLRVIIAIALLFLISSASLYSGLLNRDSFLHEGFQINFLPTVEFSSFGFSKKIQAPANLMTRNFIFAANDPSEIRRPSIYSPGETVFITFEVDGFKRDDKKVWIQEDLNVQYPNSEVAIKLDNINDFHQEMENEGSIKFENNIAIPTNADLGRYTLTITLRDLNSRQELKEQRFFYVQQSAPQVPPPSSATPLPNDTSDGNEETDEN